MSNKKLSNAIGLNYSNMSVLDFLNAHGGSSTMLLTMQYALLTYIYAHNAYIQSAINCQIDDAFKEDGMSVSSATLEKEEIKKLNDALKDNGDIEAIKDALRWRNVYGGAGLVAITQQDIEKPLNTNNLKDKKLKFQACDRWHLTTNGEFPENAEVFYYSDAENKKTLLEIDSSRVCVVNGLSIPTLLKDRLCGWGLSQLENMVQYLLQYEESMGVILELLSEAKIDVVKLDNLAVQLSTPNGEEIVRKRWSLIQQGKNYKDAIIMSNTDDYEQKQINFSSLPQMVEQIELLICSVLKRPYSKIFGKGGSGLSEQTVDLENYFSQVETETRQPANKIIKWVVDLRCLQLFGRTLPDIVIEWKPLKSVTQKEEAEIKSRKIDDLLKLLDAGIITKKQLAEKLAEMNIYALSPEEIEQISDYSDYSDVNDEKELLEK